MAITISGTDGIVGAGFTVDSSGVSVTAGVGTFSSVRGTHHGDGANLTSLPAAQITGTLPAISAANLTNIPAANITGTLPAISGANLTGIAGGITDFDRWHLTADTTGNTNPIQNNWSRWTSYGGTGTVTFAAPSSGIWTFPSTGFWHIDWFGMFTVDNKAERGCNFYLYNTTNNSSYTFVTAAETSAHDSGAVTKAWSRCTYVFDVTDTSTHKVKFAVGYNQSSNTLLGHGSYLYSNVCFTKLRDT